MEVGEGITAGDKKQAGVGARGAAIVADGEATAALPHGDPLVSNKFARRTALRPAGTRFSAEVSLAWVMGFLALEACIAPWSRHGWLWFELLATAVMLLVGCDALALWLARQEGAPVLLAPENGLRGREGQTVQVPFALTGSGRRWLRNDIRVAIMPATSESEAAFRVNSNPQRLKLGQPESVAGSTAASVPHIQLWPWTVEISFASAWTLAGATSWPRAAVAPPNLAFAAVV